MVAGVLSKLGSRRNELPFVFAQAVLVTTSGNREFADAFSQWHHEKFGQYAIVDYRNYGGATDIRKFFDTSRATHSTGPSIRSAPVDATSTPFGTKWIRSPLPMSPRR